MGNIDLMMINAPCFPQRESRSTCRLAKILILSLEEVFRGVESLLESGRKGSLYQPPQGLPSNSYYTSTTLHNGIIFAVTTMMIIKS